MNPEHLKFRVDKAGWGDGPWNDEPDRVDFHHAGFACLMLRNKHLGNWCGYVGVPAVHPAYGKNYNDVDVECHGGLTYGEKCDGSHICHVPADGESDDLFWFGFDCGHSCDVSPAMEARDKARGWDPIRFDESTCYRTAKYVRHEVERLAEQFAALGEPPSTNAVDPVPQTGQEGLRAPNLNRRLSVGGASSPEGDA